MNYILSPKFLIKFNITYLNNSEVYKLIKLQFCIE